VLLVCTSGQRARPSPPSRRACCYRGGFSCFSAVTTGWRQVRDVLVPKGRVPTLADRIEGAWLRSGRKAVVAGIAASRCTVRTESTMTSRSSCSGRTPAAAAFSTVPPAPGWPAHTASAGPSPGPAELGYALAIGPSELFALPGRVGNAGGAPFLRSGERDSSRKPAGRMADTA